MFSTFNYSYSETPSGLPECVSGQWFPSVTNSDRMDPGPRPFSMARELIWPVSGDLFATRHTTQLETFVSPFPDPLAVGVNALSLRWDE